MNPSASSPSAARLMTRAYPGRKPDVSTSRTTQPVSCSATGLPHGVVHLGGATTPLASHGMPTKPLIAALVSRVVGRIVINCPDGHYPRTRRARSRVDRTLGIAGAPPRRRGDDRQTGGDDAGPLAAAPARRGPAHRFGDRHQRQVDHPPD